MIEIIPAILATTKEEFDEKLKKVESFSELHIDICDGLFVETKTIGHEEVGSAGINVPFHVHLMVEKPEDILKEWLALPKLASLSFHIEATDKTREIIDTIHEAGKYAGLAINPETSIEIIDQFVSAADFIQFMSVHPGQYGAEFQPEVLGKIRAFHSKYPDVMLVIDGGVNPDRAKEMLDSGVRTLISGGYIMNSDNPVQALEELKKATE